MKFGEAVIIFKDINSEKYTLEEKINAIDVVMKAATINSVFKDDKTLYETVTKSANGAMQLTVGTRRLKAYKELLAWLKGEHKA